MPNEKSILDLSVIVPFKDKSELTIPCIQTLQSYGGNIKEIILVSNNSTAKEYKQIAEAIKDYPNTKLLEYNHPFNYHKINNWAAKQSSGKVIMLLNNDIELLPESTTLLKTMYEEALKPKVGSVGCVLLFEGDTEIQHAGVYLRPGSTAGHLYANMPLKTVERRIADGTYKYDIRDKLRVSAVTAAAVMVERKKFDQIGGLNEDFVIGGGDVDMGLRLEDAGYKNILIGSSHGHMIHKESKTRSVLSIPYQDFVESYKIYITHFDAKTGDRYLHWKEIPNEQQ